MVTASTIQNVIKSQDSKDKKWKQGNTDKNGKHHEHSQKPNTLTDTKLIPVLVPTLTVGFLQYGKCMKYTSFQSCFTEVQGKQIQIV